MMTRIKTDAEIAAMRTGGQILAEILQTLKQETKPGVTPVEMSRIAAEELKRLGGEPAFKGYQGVTKYPDIICISVNNQVQHTIPGEEPLKEGDVVNYDFGVRYRGMITDAGLTVGVGKISPDAERLIKGTSAALGAGIAVVSDGVRVGDISAAIEKVLKGHKLGIVQELVGHGVGHFLHEDPNIPNYGRAGTGPELKAGMTIAIEPIANLGGPGIVADRNGWTLWSADGSWSAQFEHTVLVTKDGAEILTKV
jgi:methionyl aminopeptidase